MSDPRIPEGWGFPRPTGSAHYFATGGVSLCGRWLFFGTLDPDDGVPRMSDCKACRKKMAKRPAPAPQEKP